MASLQDVPDLMEANRLAFARVEEIWDTLTSITDRSQSNGDSHDLEYLFQWFCKKLNSIDIFCDTMKMSEGSDWEDKLNNLDKGSLKLSLVCHHIKGSERVSFDSLMSRKAIAICYYVAAVNHFRCFLFISGIALEKFKDTESGSGLITRLTDRISCLSKKWNLFNTDSCKDGVLDLWKDNIEDEDWTEDAMKLLYQWVLAPLSRVTGPLMHREMEMRNDRVGGMNALACCAKWGEELCELLGTLDKYFEQSETVEFLYEPFYEWHCLTAERLRDLGFYERARELLDRVHLKLDYMEDDRMIPKWGSKQLIEFHTLSPGMKIRHKGRVLRGLYFSTGNTSYFQDYEENEKEAIGVAEVAWGSDMEKWSDEVSRMSVSGRQLNDITDLLELERYSEAEQKFKQLDRETCTSHWGLWGLRPYLELLHTRPPILFTSWESFCQMQNLLLNVSEYLGDRQLTARFLHFYGKFIGIRSLSRVPIQHRWRPQAYGIESLGGLFEAGEVSSLELWFEEELNLQFSSPRPACVQEVISCLRDPCDVDEHKRELPAMLKAYRLLKRSCDIYSDLIHNRTQGFLSDTVWLQFLESQRDAHDTLKSYLLVIPHFCREIWVETGDVTMSDLSKSIRESAFETGIAFLNSALAWVERGRTRSLLSQLGPWYSMIKHGDANHSLKDELIKFDMDEQAAITDIMASCLMAYGAGSKPLFVEYVNLGNMYLAFMIKDEGVDEPCMNVSCEEIFADRARDLNNISDCRFNCEKLRTVAGEELAYVDLKNLPDEDLEKLADPQTLNKLLYVFYEIVPRQQKSNKKCVVAKLHSILEKLYDILIRPIWERCSYQLWDPNTPVIFVPDKSLYKVPFALLRDKKTKKYLFELHTISIAPSLRVLKHCAQRRADLHSFPLKQECILAVGNPAYAEAKDLLPGTGTELMHLRERFQGRLKSLEGHEATRANFLELVKEASFSEDGHVFALMHLGVHGHWSQNMSHKTGSLQFAPPQTADICTEHLRSGQSHTSHLAQESSTDTIQARDGSIRHKSAFGEVGAITRTNSSASDSAMLPSEDIIGSGFEWRTHLAVLSACNSSRGQNHYDGEINLPRALMIAGVPAAVVSQWKIDDDASPVLMKSLYKRLQTGEGVASALQAAMIHFRECTYCCNRPDSEQNIFQWGSFVVWGLPSVALPDELYTDQSQRLDYRKLDTLLASADRICSVDKDVIDDAIFASERILARSGPVEASVFSKIVKVYTLVPLEDISRVELFLETNDRIEQLFFFRQHMAVAQAMEGSVQKALECIEWMIALLLRGGNLYDGLTLQAVRQERAVIWRIMSEYDKALEEFNALLAFGEDYECLIQMSYLKHLMGDKSGALEHACRAKRLNNPGLEQTRFISVSSRSLGLIALPDEYHRWLKDVDEPIPV